MPSGHRLLRGDDPLVLAKAWLDEAWSKESVDANAAALATADSNHCPNVRMVLVKDIQVGVSGGLVFYTNLQSKKGQEIAENPSVAMVLHWKSMQRQLRVRGPLEPVTAAEADAYFASRPYLSRIGAWASQQSAEIKSRAALVASAAKFAKRYPKDPPRPPHWSGFQLRPLEMEFWLGHTHRMHDRFRWRREHVDATNWSRARLSP